LKKNEKEEVQETEEETKDSLDPSVLFLNSPFELGEGDPVSKLRALSLYGEVSEERTAELIYSMLYLKETGENPLEEDESQVTYEPFKLIISTYGGSAAEMFSVYDIIRMIRADCEIHTMGLGKVMSAGVLLLAAGTKGKRKIGKNCRVMLHSVVGSSYGSIDNLENEMDEIKWLQEQHVKCLIEETKMTKRYIKKLLNKKVNVYLTAEEAVQLGIADIII
jgi:ATP-dependent Clp protease protease subunit